MGYHDSVWGGKDERDEMREVIAKLERQLTEAQAQIEKLTRMLTGSGVAERKPSLDQLQAYKWFE